MDLRKQTNTFQHIRNLPISVSLEQVKEWIKHSTTMRPDKMDSSILKQLLDKITRN